MSYLSDIIFRSWLGVLIMIQSLFFIYKFAVVFRLSKSSAKSSKILDSIANILIVIRKIYFLLAPGLILFFIIIWIKESLTLEKALSFIISMFLYFMFTELQEIMTLKIKKENWVIINLEKCNTSVSKMLLEKCAANGALREILLQKLEMKNEENEY